MEALSDSLQAMRKHFETGATLSYEFRMKQLQALKQLVLTSEKEISASLYSDLKKSEEESYAGETGILLSELNITIKNLRRWMRPKRVPTDLTNIPSSSTIYRDPLGVVLIIAPWNYPFHLVMVPLVGAIAGGNCAVVKPSELAPATAGLVEKLITAIFPPEYIKVIVGDGSSVIPLMMERFRFDYVFYTGGIAVGKLIYKMAAENLVPVTLELGGKSPAIIEKDADLAVAARRIALGKFANAGQTCIAPDYVLVHQEVKENFITLLKSTIVKFYSKDPSESYEYGRIINERRFDKLLGFLDEGKIAHGGQHQKEQLFLAPTVMEDVDEDSIVMKEEIFGPILPILGYNTREEALSIVQRNPNPLALYLFTNSEGAEREWIAKVPFGCGCINNTVWQVKNPHLPFGGVGSSGTGAYHGKFTFETFTRAKGVLKTPTWFDPAVKYPPFKGKLKLFKWVIR